MRSIMSIEKKFSAATIIVPVLNETYSLEKTIDIIRRTCDQKDIEEYLIVVCERTTPESLAVCQKIKNSLGNKSSIHHQTLPFIGGAMREAFDLAKGSHTIMMSSDLETDPEVIKIFIEKAKENPAAIITASRWIKGGSFEGYSSVKLIANYVFQKLFSVLYFCKLTDLTYGFRIFPSKLIKSIKWEELKHPFFLETAIKPLRLGTKIIEVPAIWKPRSEGESINPFFANFAYFKIAFKVRFYSRGQILGDINEK